MQDLCKLASSGISQYQYLFIALGLILLTILACLQYKKLIKIIYLFPILMIVFIGLSSLRMVDAASGNNCPAETANSQHSDNNTSNNNTGDTDETEALGGLVDDNPELEYDEDDGSFFGRFSVLPNDTEPDGDPFDISTLQLVSDFQIIDSSGWETHLILDPNNQTLPDPDSDWWNNPNVWGSWYLVLTCDLGDTDHCGTTPVPNSPPSCYDPSDGTCWPSGEVVVSFTNLNAEPGDYTIQYTVNTESGIPLIPATITVTLPEGPPEPSPITSSNVSDATACETWPNDFSLDLMNGSFFSTTGPGTLLANTIDLDPQTPGRQTTITIYAQSNNSIYTTYTVNNEGILTMTTPQSEYEGFNTSILYFTIEDSNGFTPDNPASYTRYPACE